MNKSSSGENLLSLRPKWKTIKTSNMLNLKAQLKLITEKLILLLFIEKLMLQMARK